MTDEKIRDQLWLVWEKHGFRYSLQGCRCGKKMDPAEHEVHVEVEVFKAGLRSMEES